MNSVAEQVAHGKHRATVIRSPRDKAAITLVRKRGIVNAKFCNNRIVQPPSFTELQTAKPIKLHPRGHILLQGSKLSQSQAMTVIEAVKHAVGLDGPPS